MLDSLLCSLACCLLHACTVQSTVKYCEVTKIYKTGSREMRTNHQGSRATVHLNAGSWEHRAVTVAPPYECPARATASTSSFPTHRKHRSKSKLLCNC